jgi:hypothetical protein
MMKGAAPKPVARAIRHVMERQALGTSREIDDGYCRAIQNKTANSYVIEIIMQ